MPVPPSHSDSSTSSGRRSVSETDRDSRQEYVARLLVLDVDFVIVAGREHIIRYIDRAIVVCISRCGGEGRRALRTGPGNAKPKPRVDVLCAAPDRADADGHAREGRTLPGR